MKRKFNRLRILIKIKIFATTIFKVKRAILWLVIAKF